MTLKTKQLFSVVNTIFFSQNSQSIFEQTAFRSGLLLGVFFSALSLLSYGQSISIGSPIDGEEGATNVSFVISLDNGDVNTTGSGINGLIQYSGTANLSSDFVGFPPALFNIPNGQPSDTIVLTVDNDGCVESTETVIATISSPNVGVVNNASSSAIILDDDAANANIVIDVPGNGAENGNNITFYVAFVPAYTNCSGGPITGTITYSGTAAEGVDYTSDATFSIPEGSSFVVVSLPVIDDALNECDETVIATISNPSVSSINPNESTLTMIIEDDDCVIGLEDLDDFGLSMYPNPTTHRLNFEAEQQMNSYSIIDLNGRMLSQGEIHSKEVKLNTEFLAAGTYVLHILFENGTRLNKKVLKE